MELELIERLKNKQAEQRKAYQQLEAVLSLGSVRCVELAGLPGCYGASGASRRWPSAGLLWRVRSIRVEAVGLLQAVRGTLCLPGSAVRAH